jgi:hypothetical protein
MQLSTSIMEHHVSILDQMQIKAAPESGEEEAGAFDGDAGLDDAARDEQEYVRGRLREELKREPTEEEIDEWLREHTEGY